MYETVDVEGSPDIRSGEGGVRDEQMDDGSGGMVTTMPMEMTRKILMLIIKSSPPVTKMTMTTSLPMTTMTKSLAVTMMTMVTSLPVTTFLPVTMTTMKPTTILPMQ